MAPRKDDRRKSPRHFVRILVDYAASDSFLYDYSNDLSEGGVFIQTNAPLEMGEKLSLRFTLPGTDRLFQLEGEVMWVNKRKDPALDNEEQLGDALDDLLEANLQAGEELGEQEVVPDGMGVRFTNITPEEQALLREFLTRERY